MPTTYRRGLARAAVVLLVLVVTLAGCAGDDDPQVRPTPTSSGPTGPAGPQPSAADERLPEYVALGDSYTAAPLVPVTDTAYACLRSSANYPSLVATQLPSFRLTDVSCSGASSTSMIGVQVSGDQANLPQFDALDEDTALVTVSIGANDASLFSTMIKTCTELSLTPSLSPCTDALTAGGVDQLRAKLRDTLGHVTAVVRGIRNRAPKARIVVVDYPQIFPDADVPCAALPIKAGDLPYVRGINQLLSATIRQAARDAGVGATPINLWAASKGHDICSADPWINGRTTDPTRASAYHPFANEQQAAAQLVLAAIKTR